MIRYVGKRKVCFVQKHRGLEPAIEDLHIVTIRCYFFCLECSGFSIPGKFSHICLEQGHLWFLQAKLVHLLSLCTLLFTVQKNLLHFLVTYLLTVMPFDCEGILGRRHFSLHYNSCYSSSWHRERDR